MKNYNKICIIVVILLTYRINQVSSYWDIATTTTRPESEDKTARQSFFRWQWVFYGTFGAGYNFDANWNAFLGRLRVFAGVSIDFKCLSTAIIMNRRALITAYNYLDPHMNRMHDLRVWALGRAGLHYTPFRYRVYRAIRVIPKSLNKEHCHGPLCRHSPRHDLSILFTLDQMYIFRSVPTRYHYAYRGFIPTKYQVLPNDLWMGGTGYENLDHVRENYKIVSWPVSKWDIVDCSKYLPKWWGKFICVINRRRFSAVPNGGGLMGEEHGVYAIGCFEIRYNEDRIMVFTDLRYYITTLRYHLDYLWAGAYYEYAYPQWGIKLGLMYDGGAYTYNNPYIPEWQIQQDLYPYGK